MTTTDGQRTDDDDGTDGRTDARTEDDDDDGDDGTDGWTEDDNGTRRDGRLMVVKPFNQHSNIQKNIKQKQDFRTFSKTKMSSCFFCL